MPRKIEKNAKSKEEALRLAAEEFGVPVEELSYTVEREIGKGILGKLLGREVIISAWVTKEAEEEQRIRETRELRRRKMEEQKAAEEAAKAAAEAKKRAGKAKTAEKPAGAKPEKKSEPKPRPDSTDAKSQETPPKTEKSSSETRRREVTEKSLKDAQYFAENLIHLMGLEDAKVEVANGGKSVDVTVSGERMGLLIGKRGDTLDAVQYLTGLYVNKDKNSYIKVNIDTEGYRAKREETLVRLAESLERKAVREGHDVVLEPMSPNERRIIHAALQGSEGVKTYSVGEEPNRKVVIALKD